jgi:signal transduction histidine kinase
MVENLNQPRAYDAVLGGLPGVKRRLTSDAIGYRIAALKEALNYGQAGLDLVIQILKDESDPLHWAAYLFLKQKAEQEVKQALQEYYGNQLTSKMDVYEFLASFSHELRTPLHSIVGFCQLILDGMVDNPHEQREFIQETYRSAMHLLNTINDRLDICTIELDKIELYLSPVKLNEILSKVEEISQTKAQQKGLNLSMQIPANPKIILYCDKCQLLKVLFHLVDNAIKFTYQGKINISIEVIKKKVLVKNRELPGLVKFEVSDSGIGMSVERQEELFQTSSRRRHGYKIGWGLSISKKLVELMGGQITFYSPGEGLGSTVTFTIPLYSLNGLTH